MCYFRYLSVDGQADRQMNKDNHNISNCFLNIKLVKSAFAIKGLIEALILLTRKVFKTVINAVYILREKV